MLITKDRELAKLLTVAQAQKELHARIEHYKEEVAQLNSKITEFQKKLISASSILDPALHRAKDRVRDKFKINFDHRRIFMASIKIL